MVHLVPMQADEFQAYLDKTIPNYAAESIKAGYWAEKVPRNLRKVASRWGEYQKPVHL